MQATENEELWDGAGRRPYKNRNAIASNNSEFRIFVTDNTRAQSARRPRFVIEFPRFVPGAPVPIRDITVGSPRRHEEDGEEELELPDRSHLSNEGAHRYRQDLRLNPPPCSLSLCG